MQSMTSTSICVWQYLQKLANVEMSPLQPHASCSFNETLQWMQAPLAFREVMPYLNGMYGGLVRGNNALHILHQLTSCSPTLQSFQHYSCLTGRTAMLSMLIVYSFLTNHITEGTVLARVEYDPVLLPWCLSYFHYTHYLLLDWQYQHQLPFLLQWWPVNSIDVFSKQTLMNCAVINKEMDKIQWLMEYGAKLDVEGTLFYNYGFIALRANVPSSPTRTVKNLSRLFNVHEVDSIVYQFVEQLATYVYQDNCTLVDHLCTQYALSQEQTKNVPSLPFVLNHYTCAQRSVSLLSEAKSVEMLHLLMALGLQITDQVLQESAIYIPSTLLSELVRFGCRPQPLVEGIQTPYAPFTFLHKMSTAQVHEKLHTIIRARRLFESQVLVHIEQGLPGVATDINKLVASYV
jgi:hypothetical protein